MPKQDHSYLGLSVLPELRPFIISADAAVLFSDDLTEILWANANGAKLFGGRGVVDLLGVKLSENLSIIKQLKACVVQLDGNKPLSRGFRINQGNNSVLLKFTITPVDLSHGDVGYLVENKPETGAEDGENTLSDLAIEALTGFADASAILDDYGLTIAASSQFGELGPVDDALSGFVEELKDEDDRLIKRAITGTSGNIIAIGLARICDDPGRNLVVLADTHEKADTGDTAEKADLSTQDEDFEEELIDNDSDDDDSDDDETVIITNTADTTSHTPKEAGNTDKNEQPDDQRDVDAAQTSNPYLPHEDGEPSLESASGEEIDETAKEIVVNLEERGNISATGENFLYFNEKDDVRFAWTMDRDGVFQTVSPELSRTVGPNASDLTGNTWQDIANQYRFDQNGEIAKKFSKQETWSGKTVLWPVQGTDMVIPVDLAALPVFGSDKQFEGFKGFGIIRTVDAIVDEHATGLALVGARHPSDTPAEPEEDHSDPQMETGSAEEDEEIMLGSSSFEQEDGFGNDETLPKSDFDEDEEPEVAQETDDDDTNIVRLVPRDNTAENRKLSTKENTAFKVIGETLLGMDETDEAEPGPQEKTTHLDTSLMENLPVAILVYRTDELLFANDRMLEATGYENLESLAEAGGVEAILNTGDSDETISQGKQYLTMRNGVRAAIDPVLHTVPWQGKKALLLSFPAVTDADVILDEPLALEISTSSEIQNILDTATDGIILMEEDGTVISINASAEALFGITYDEASSTGFKELFAQESQEIISEYLETLSAPSVDRLLNDGREVIAQEKNGGLIPIFVTISRMDSSNKFCAVIRDMTSWKKVEEELIQSRREAIQASEQKTDFLAHVSHEIRTPLNAIIGFSDVMIEEKFGPIDNQRYREYLRDINRSGSHVLELVNDLLDLSKIEAGKLELSFEAVELNQIVAETVALLQPQANSNRIIIRTSLSRAVPKVVADPRSIRQIILNLVSNAIKFSPANSQVIVSTIYESNGEVAMRVRDTGHGMSKSEIEEAMKPFHQLHSVNERAGEGTGLGLPLTKALVEANRALFDIESEPGTGTIAHVQFPNQRVLTD